MHIESTNKQSVFKGDEDGHQLLKLIDDMGWDYDRFSSSGQETYDKICVILGGQIMIYTYDETTGGATTYRRRIIK